MRNFISNLIIRFSKNEYFVCEDKINLGGLKSAKDRVLYKHFKLIDKNRKVFSLIEREDKFNSFTGQRLKTFLFSKNDLDRITKNMLGNVNKRVTEYTSYNDFKEHLLSDLRETIAKEVNRLVSKAIPKNPMPLELKLLTDIENILIVQKFSKYPDEHVDSAKSITGIVTIEDLIAEKNNGNKTPIKRVVEKESVEKFDFDDKLQGMIMPRVKNK